MEFHLKLDKFADVFLKFGNEKSIDCVYFINEICDPKLHLFYRFFLFLSINLLVLDEVKTSFINN